MEKGIWWVWNRIYHRHHIGKPHPPTATPPYTSQAPWPRRGIAPSQMRISTSTGIQLDLKKAMCAASSHKVPRSSSAATSGLWKPDHGVARSESGQRDNKIDVIIFLHQSPNFSRTNKNLSIFFCPLIVPRPHIAEQWHESNAFSQSLWSH